VRVFAVVTTWEMANKYQIKNSLGQQVYFASEGQSRFWSFCCKTKRRFSYGPRSFAWGSFLLSRWR